MDSETSSKSIKVTPANSRKTPFYMDDRLWSLQRVNFLSRAIMNACEKTWKLTDVGHKLLLATMEKKPQFYY